MGSKNHLAFQCLYLNHNFPICHWYHLLVSFSSIRKSIQELLLHHYLLNKYLNITTCVGWAQWFHLKQCQGLIKYVLWFTDLSESGMKDNKCVLSVLHPPLRRVMSVGDKSKRHSITDRMQKGTIRRPNICQRHSVWLQEPGLFTLPDCLCLQGPLLHNLFSAYKAAHSCAREAVCQPEHAAAGTFLIQPSRDQSLPRHHQRSMQSSY